MDMYLNNLFYIYIFLDYIKYNWFINFLSSILYNCQLNNRFTVCINSNIIQMALHIKYSSDLNHSSYYITNNYLLSISISNYYPSTHNLFYIINILIYYKLDNFIKYIKNINSHLNKLSLGILNNNCLNKLNME